MAQGWQRQEQKIQSSHAVDLVKHGLNALPPPLGVTSLADNDRSRVRSKQPFCELIARTIRYHDKACTELAQLVSGCELLVGGLLRIGRGVGEEFEPSFDLCAFVAGSFE
jgi:hypothetical protein